MWGGEGARAEAVLSVSPCSHHRPGRREGIEDELSSLRPKTCRGRMARSSRGQGDPLARAGRGGALWDTPASPHSALSLARSSSARGVLRNVPSACVRRVSMIVKWRHEASRGVEGLRELSRLCPPMQHPSDNHRQPQPSGSTASRYRQPPPPAATISRGRQGERYILFGNCPATTVVEDRGRGRRSTRGRQGEASGWGAACGLALLHAH